MRLHVAADDRTGALETAAALADRLGRPVGVSVWPDPVDAGVAVLDLASRHLTAEQAARRAGQAESAGRVAHKIDSTLRGNWAAELVARHRRSGRPVLVVAALPALGRTCEGGVVLEHRVPVHAGSAGIDARQRVGTSRPADHLAAADAVGIEEIARIEDVAAWLAEPSGFVVADAVSDADIVRLVEAWRGAPEVLLAGTSAVIGAAADADTEPVSRPAIDGPVLIVNGSLHAAAIDQVGLAAAHGASVVGDGDVGAAVAALAAGRHVVLTAGPVAGGISAVEAELAAEVAATRTRQIADRADRLGAIVVIGGDTAAAVLGNERVLVHGSVTPGTAWVESPRFAVPVVTRAGGFGDVEALVELVWNSLVR